MFKRLSHFCYLWLTVLLFSVNSAAQADKILNLGIYAHVDEATLHEQFAPLVTYLNENLPGIQVQYQVLPAQALRQAIRQNQFDLLLTNPSLYQIIRHENSLGGAIATLQVMHDGQAISHLGGVIFTRSGSKIHQLKQLEGQKVVAPNDSNTGAYRIPLYELHQQKINYASIQFQWVGNNDEVVRAVMDGRAEAGFVRTGILESWFAKGLLKPDDVEVLNLKNFSSFPFLVSTKLYPEWPFYALAHVSDEDIKALSVALFNLKADHPAAKAASIAGFVPALDYLPFETLLRDLRLYPYVTPEFSLIDFWHAYFYQILVVLAVLMLVLLLLAISLSLSVKLKQTAHLAKQEALRVQSFINATQSGTWEWHLITGELHFNEFWAKALGYELSELKPHLDTFKALLHPSEEQKVERAFEQYLNGETPLFDVEVRLRHKEGSWRWMLGRGQILVWDADQKPLLMSGTFTEITQSKQQQAQLQRKASRDAVFLALPHLLENKTEKAFVTEALALIEEQTQSLVSFMHNYHEPSQMIELLSWSHRTLENYCQMGDIYRRYPLKEAGIWADCIRNKQPMIINDYAQASSPFKHGLPEGHAPLQRFLTVPIFDKSSVVMLLGVANKVEPYDAEDLEDIQLLGSEVYRLLQLSRNQLKLQQAANVFRYSQEGIVMTDAHAHIIEMNHSYLKMCGYSREELLGKNPRLLSSGKQDKLFYAEVWRAIFSQGYWKGEMWNRHKSGAIYPQLAHISAVKDSEGKITQFLGLFSDISTQKAQQAALEKIAHYDPLTQLPNRTLLTDRLEQAMARANRNGKLLAVGFMDLDGFKAVNDTHGHEAGDYLLIVFAHRLQKLLRIEDTLARLGGDEFVLVIVDLARAEQIKGLLNRILEETLQVVSYQGANLQVSVSMGVSFYTPQPVDLQNPTDTKQQIDADQLLRQADQAMYRAKNLGKNQVVIFQEHFSDQMNEGSLSKEVSAALDAGEFCLYYQPKVNLKQGKIDSFEALIRWQHPRKGLIMPGDFLGQIANPETQIKMSFWVIKTALQQMLTWQKYTNASFDFANVLLQKMAQDPNDYRLSVFADLRVSVNIDATTLEHPEFTQRLKGLLDEYPQIHPSFLTLEILESSALQDIHQISQVIMSTRALGVNFAIDDFGVGYASLNYLRDLPVHEIKVDQTFVATLLEKSQSLSILEAILAMSEAFAYHVIAEGVETAEHIKILQQLGYELVQGYAISRPLPAEAVVDWIQNWQPEAAWSSHQPLSREGRFVLTAMVEHQIWMKQFQQWTLDTTAPLPKLEASSCRFGEWLRLRSESLLDKPIEREVLKQIDQEHIEIHAKASVMVKLLEQQDNEQVENLLTELLQRHQQLLALLNNLLVDKLLKND